MAAKGKAMTGKIDAAREKIALSVSASWEPSEIDKLVRLMCIPPPKAVCPDLLIGVKSMAYVMRYNHFPD